MTLMLFSKKNNLEWQKAGAANSPLALHHGVDFDLLDTTFVIDEPYASDLQSGKLSQGDLEPLLRKYNNVASEIRFKLVAVKPPA